MCSVCTVALQRPYHCVGDGPASRDPRVPETLHSPIRRPHLHMKHHLQRQNSTDELMRHYGQNVSTTLDGCGAFAVSDICLQIMAPHILVDVCLLLIIRLINVHVEAVKRIIPTPEFHSKS